MPKTVTSDTFDPPQHKLSTPIQDSLKLLLGEHESQLAKDETYIGTTPLMSMTIDTGTVDPVSQKPYPIAMKHYEWVKNEIEKNTCCHGNLHQPVQLVSTYYSCSER